ncbi:MAG TPA: alpha/beta hydrolase [Porticoccaceae bacterium]|jgi:acetyl esterase/lipase|nr:alpha/beta hydrolase [Porticoccaceae bacterium]
MASIRSKITASIMRQTMKRKLGRSGDVEKERRFLDKMTSLTSSRKLGRSVTVGGVPGEWQLPIKGEPERTILYLHGGGYVLGSPDSHRDMVGAIADAAQARALILDYRLAPETPFPGAVEDAVAAYKALLDEGEAPEKIFIAGDSAGGGLTAATLVSIKDQGLPNPAGGVCLSPWADLTFSGASMNTKALDDAMLSKETLSWMGGLYLAGQDAGNPLASPIFADLSGLPPLLIQVGGDEVLLDDALRLHEAGRSAGVDVTLEVWDQMMHVWHLMAMAVPEGKLAIKGIGEFMKKHAA